MLPVIALVGRPNVGKSTLFNCLTKTRSAIISSHPGTTRDRQYGEAQLNDEQRYIVIDTGGITDEKEVIDQLITQQAKQAIHEANCILFVVDYRDGVRPEDIAIAKLLRKRKSSVLVVINKAEHADEDLVAADFYQLGFGEPIPISASHRRGLTDLNEKLVSMLALQVQSEPLELHAPGIRLAIVGKPNVGKSTLTNRLLGEERVIVNDAPGTTRDSIAIPFQRYDEHYILIDTAGVRRRKNISELPEKFSIVKTMQAIESANVVLFVIDGHDGISEQDLRLLSFILECGKALVVAINKWDGLTEEQKIESRRKLDLNLDFVAFADMHFISALHGSNVGHLFKSIQSAYASAMKKLSTPILNQLLKKAVETHNPPLVHGRRVKMRYAHAGGQNPPVIVIHGTQLHELPLSYQKYLAHFFQRKLKLTGTPVKIEFKNNKNPYVE